MRDRRPVEPKRAVRRSRKRHAVWPLLVVLGTALWLNSAPVWAQGVPRGTVVAQTPAERPSAPQLSLEKPDGEGGKSAAAVKPAPAAAPMPQKLNPLVRNPRLQQLGSGPLPIGTTPRPSAETIKEYSKYVERFVDPENTLDLVEGRTRLMILKERPFRVQIADETVATLSFVSRDAPRELALLGVRTGTTTLHLWFGDETNPAKQRILSYLVRVLPDPEAKERLERAYQALEEEINRAFPDSYVHLFLVGDKLVVTGQAKDIAEATQILRVIRANAPVPEAAQVPVNQVNVTLQPGPDGLPPQGLENFLLSGGPNIINLLRVPGEQQVSLRVVVAEVNRAAARSIGLNFTLRNNEGLTYFANNTGSIATGGVTGGFGGLGGFSVFNLQGQAGVAGGLGGFNNLPAALDNGQVQLAISALRTLNYARSLAEPVLVTMNGQTATFQAGGAFPVPVVTGFTAAGLQGVSFFPFGVQLSFTPYVTDKDRIRLTIAAEVSTRDLQTGVTFIGSAAVPSLITRNFFTTVELREGQTLAVAGLIQTNIGADATRVPFFGDLPIVGRLAAFDRTTAGEQELIVLITPELVHPMEPEEVPPLPGSDLFEPGDLEFYLLGRLESRRSYDYRTPVMTDLHRMKSYRRCEQIYIVGPHGHSDGRY
ncbi:MAG: secretion system protein [Gemmataceae bacterium]